MHIAYNGWFWDQPGTGSGQYARRLLHALRRLSPELRMSLILPPGAEPDDLPANVDVIETRGSRSNLGKVWWEQNTFPRAVAKLRPDIAHVLYWGAPLSSPARLVTSVLDVIALELPEYAENWRARLYTSLVAASARGSAHVLTLSHAAKTDILKHLQLADDQVTVTHLAADERFHPRLGAERDAEVRRKYDLPDRFILYMGGFDVRKRVTQLLHAFTYVSQAEGDEAPLVIAGREPRWGTPMFPDLRALADELKVADFTRWIGYVDEEDKPSLYRLATVFVYPSAYEGFGLPLLEAMACGTPVIANEIPVFEEISGDAVYLTRDGDARAMAGAILAVLGQDSLRETQITRGLAQATNFSWRKAARTTLEVYEKVMAVPAGR